MTTDARIQLKNPNTGRDDVKIARRLYDPVRDAIVAAGRIAFQDLRAEVERDAPPTSCGGKRASAGTRRRSSSTSRRARSSGVCPAAAPSSSSSRDQRAPVGVDLGRDARRLCLPLRSRRGHAAPARVVHPSVVAAPGPVVGARRSPADPVEARARLDIGRAHPDDAGEIIALQRAAYRIEAERYDDFGLPPLTETADTAHIARLSVLPALHGQGIGRQLLAAIEHETAPVRRYELFTGHRSERNLRMYERAGYRRIHTEPQSDAVLLIFMEKARR